MKATTQDKKARFALLTDKLCQVINDELFLDAEQKHQLVSKLSMINIDLQRGITEGIQMRLYAIYNTMRTLRAENLFPSLKRNRHTQVNTPCKTKTSTFTYWPTPLKRGSLNSSKLLTCSA